MPKDPDCIFVGFDVSESFHGPAGIIRLDRLVRDLLDGSATRISPITGVDETIYRVQVPILYADDDMRTLFTKLQELFGITARMKPHFTSGYTPEEEGQHHVRHK